MQVSLFTVSPERHRFWWVKGCDGLPKVEHPDTAPHCSYSTQHPHHHPRQQTTEPGGWEAHVLPRSVVSKTSFRSYNLSKQTVLPCSPNPWVWLGNQTSVLDGPWPEEKLVLPEVSESSNDGRGFSDRQKKVRAQSRSREPSITPTEEGESGSLFNWKMIINSVRENTYHTFFNHAFFNLNVNSTTLQVCVLKVHRVSWHGMYDPALMHLPARDPEEDCLVLNPRNKGRVGEGSQNQNRSQKLAVTSSLTPVSAPYPQTASQDLR